jgi:predicted dehydrogenase
MCQDQQQLEFLDAEIARAPMTDPIRWGILGTGSIARSFAAALRHVADAELVAVGSRAQDSADQFAADHEVPRGYGSYDDLVGDDGVDVVYVATPHTRHAADMALALEKQARTRREAVHHQP